MNSVHDFKRTDKTLFIQGFISKEVALVLIVFLASTASFALGRLSYKESVQKELRVGEASLESMSAEAFQSMQNLSPEDEVLRDTTQSIVGSKNGTKYHYTTCPGAKQISKENLIYFSSIEDAREKGYSPASNCKGLE